MGTRALNLAQSFNPVGAVAGVLLGRQLILGSDSIEAVGAAYCVLGSIFAAVASGFWLTRFPTGEGASAAVARPPMRVALVLSCTRRRGFTMALVAQFLNIGAQTCVWSFTIRYVRMALPGVSDQDASNALLLSLCLFLVGRCASTSLLHCVAAERLLCVQCVLAALVCAVAASTGTGWLGVVALCLVSPCFGMAFPTIFSLAMAELDPEHSEVGAALLVMTIIGGAIMAPLMGFISDGTGSVAIAYFVPAAAFLAIALYALAHSRGLFSTSASRHVVSVSTPSEGMLLPNSTAGDPRSSRAGLTCAAPLRRSDDARLPVESQNGATA